MVARFGITNKRRQLFEDRSALLTCIRGGKKSKTGSTRSGSPGAVFCRQSERLRCVQSSPDLLLFSHDFVGCVSWNTPFFLPQTDDSFSAEVLATYLERSRVLFGRGVPKRSYPLTAAITHNTVLYSRHLFLVAGWYLKTGLFCIARLYDAYGTKIPALESKARLCTCAYTSRESQRTAVYAVGHVPPREIREAYGQAMTNTRKWRALGSMSSPLGYVR